jgi:hypothetical protein
MKYRLILPGTYILLLLLFAAFFLMGAGGHGTNPFDFIVSIMMPLCLLLDRLPASWGPKSDLASLLLCALAGLVQWTLIGYLIDRVLARKRKDD